MALFLNGCSAGMTEIEWTPMEVSINEKDYIVCCSGYAKLGKEYKHFELSATKKEDEWEVTIKADGVENVDTIKANADLASGITESITTGITEGLKK